MASRLLVQRDDLTHTRMDTTPSSELTEGQVQIAVERFAVTANNITYGVAGDMIGYWQFFPAEEDMGCIPVWGIGRVTESTVDQIDVGTRYYGYFPMGDSLTVEPQKVGPNGFTDGAEHRSALPVVYNQYVRVGADNGFADGQDNHHMLYRPLFTTSFVLDDYLEDNSFFGAQQIVLGSASSKTAIGLAWMLSQRDNVTCVGLTSAGNKAFVESMGLYDSVLTYDEVESMQQVPSAYVDMAGNREVLSRVHHHLTDNLTCSCGVGITHWDSRDGAAPDSLPGAAPSMFFAPSQIVKRNEELGPAVYQQKLGEATARFFAAVDAWINIEEFGYDQLQQVYTTVLQGPAPSTGYVVAV